MEDEPGLFERIEEHGKGLRGEGVDGARQDRQLGADIPGGAQPIVPRPEIARRRLVERFAGPLAGDE